MEPSNESQLDTLVIRGAVIDDLPGILDLYSQLFSNTDQASQNSKELLPEHSNAFSEIEQSPICDLFVAERAGAVIGTLMITIIPNVSHCGRCWAVIENVVVDKRARESSVGTAMMQHAIALAQAQGCFRVVLSSSMQRGGSHKFYRSLGLEPFGYSFSMFLPQEMKKQA
ncbi:MAG: GNAT family N-acetyltransferase [Euryarchaeota archaeon]|nr:GNAT family N-acetyltransferase [Euryarchaeota archaeon]